MAQDINVQGMAWDEFREFFRLNWAPGEHVSVIAPSGGGKTTFVCGILDQRRYVLAADPKGGDETLAALNLRRLTEWPGEKRMSKMIDDDEQEGRPSRFIVGPVVNRGADLAKLRQAILESLSGAFDMGGWTYYLDEAQVAADRRMMNLSGPMDKLLVAARSKKVSVVLSFQQPKWVTAAAMTQPTWLVTSYTRDTDTVNRMAELLGRPKSEIRGAVKGLEKYTWLIVGRDPRSPLILTQPPRLAPRKAE